MAALYPVVLLFQQSPVSVIEMLDKPPQELSGKEGTDHNGKRYEPPAQPGQDPQGYHKRDRDMNSQKPLL